jgi:hypothetical protein
MRTWICDVCGKPVNEQDGWVEWMETPREGEKDMVHGLRLVHNASSCQYNRKLIDKQDKSSSGDGPLENYLGVDGLILLLSMLSQHRWDERELLDMIQRLHIPHYEEARPFFDDGLEHIEPNLSPGYYWQDELIKIAEYGKKKA